MLTYTEDTFPATIQELYDIIPNKNYNGLKQSLNAFWS